MTRVSVVHADIPTTIKWDKMDGGDLSHTNSRFFVAPLEEVVWEGRSARDNITVEAHLDPVAHASFIKAGNSGSKFKNATIKVESLDTAGIPVGEPDTYTGCAVAKWSPRKSDLNAEDMQKIMIEWEVPAP